MAHDLGRIQGATMAQVEALSASLHEAFEFAGNFLRIVFERRADRAAGQGYAADQNPRGDQIADQGVFR